MRDKNRIDQRTPFKLKRNFSKEKARIILRKLIIKAKMEENLPALDNYDFRAKQQNLTSKPKKLHITQKQNHNSFKNLSISSNFRRYLNSIIGKYGVQSGKGNISRTPYLNK